MSIELVKGIEEESESEKIANGLIRRRMIIEFVKIAFPYFLSGINFCVVAYVAMFPSELRIISEGIFFAFSIVVMRVSKSLWT